MLKNKYSLGVITGIISCLIISSLVTQVMANNFSFLGPSGTNPPNGRVVPTLDGLNINGDLKTNNIYLVRGGKIGSQYQRSLSREITPNNSYIGSLRIATVSCNEGTILQSCSGSVRGDGTAAFDFAGTDMNASTRTCNSYMKQTKATNTTPVYLYVKANCLDPAGILP